MKKLTTLSILFISLAFIAPVQASAATSAGVKPGSFFYFFDTTFENVSLFFTFDSKNKAKKALGYADERLAEIEAVAEEKNSDAVKTAIANYESNMALATEKSKDVKDKGQAESLFTLIEDSSSKNQEVLATVLIKVPEEAREAITRAIEASRKGQEEAAKQISELKGEVEKLKQEVAKLKARDEEREKTIEELSKQKEESSAVRQKAVTPQTQITPTQKSEAVQSQTSPKPEPAKTSIVTLPNGAVVEMDANGNIIRTIQVAPQRMSAVPVPTIVNNVGDLPIESQFLTVTSPPPSPSLPKVTVSPGKVDRRNNQPYKKPGEKEYIFAGIKITTDQKVVLNSIRWHQSGSASFTGLFDNGNPVYPNVKTYINDTAYNISFSVDGKYIISELGGIILNSGEATDIYIKGDLAQIKCTSKNGCSTDDGLICKFGETCSGCKDDGTGRCQYPHQKIDIDIYTPKDIGIVDEKGNTIIPEADQLWNYENSGGFRSITPWYDGYRIEMEPQPPRP